MVQVKFKKSPTGAFGLAYSAGQVGYVSPEIAARLEKTGFAEIIRGAGSIEDATDKAVEKRETRPGRGKASSRRKKT